MKDVLNVHVSIDDVSYREKPAGGEIAAIRKRTADNWCELDLSKLADLVGNRGVSFIPAHMVGGTRAVNCTEMQLFVLDFDKDITSCQVMEKCEDLGLIPGFAYHTLSSTSEKERFRLVFVHETVIDDTFIIDIVLNMMTRIFNGCDSSCKDKSRIFLGGKELICFNEDARLALVKLISPFYASMGYETGNFVRNVRSFCGQNQILMINDRAAMGDGSYLPSLYENDENMDRAVIHITADSRNSSFFAMESDKFHKSITCKEAVKRISVPDSNSACQLLDDFNAGVDIGHQGRFAVITNLLHIDGGQKHFFEVLEKYADPERFEKWKRDCIYLKGYKSQRCGPEFCPYYDDCENMGTIVDTLAMSRQVNQKEEQYVSEKEAKDNMRTNLEEAVSAEDDGIHLIHAQTGIGKTESYEELIAKNSDKAFIVAVSTNRLKKQVAKALRLKGVSSDDMFVTPSTQKNAFIPNEIQEEIAWNHESGIHDKTKRLVEEYYEQIRYDPNMPAVREELETILKGTDAIDGQRVIVTTHAYLMQIPAEKLSGYTILIDEDILQLQFFSRIFHISEALLKQAVEREVPYYSEIAERILSAKEDHYERLHPMDFLYPLKENQLEKYDLWWGPGDNLNDLSKATAFVRKEDGVYYFCPMQLPEQKCIILSATLDEGVYQLYFGESRKLVAYPEKKARYKGRLVQYTYRSLGRRDLQKNLWVFPFARELAGRENIPIITFKKFEEEAGKDCRGMHYGNSMGLNDLSGEDIALIGTPYSREETYKLVATHLGTDVNGKDDVRPVYRRVEYKGSQFLLVSYKNELLTRVEMYAIASELEQAVGRARLLWNDCCVYVFSCFPCEQAELHTKNYFPQLSESENG